MSRRSLSLSPRWFTVVAACVVGFCGALVLIGWALDITAFKSVRQGLPPMIPLTAIAFILAGWSLWCLSERPIGQLRRQTARAAAVGVMLLAAVAFGKYMFGW